MKICSSKDCTFGGGPQRSIAFGRDKSRSDGLCRYCKICVKTYQEKYRKSPEGKAVKRAYDKSPEGKAKAKEYWRSPKRKAAQKGATKAYRKSAKGKASQKAARNTPEERVKRQARKASCWAERLGVIIRPEVCDGEGCNETEDTNGKPFDRHHWRGWSEEDGSWIDIQFMCRKCHPAADAKLRAARNLSGPPASK